MKKQMFVVALALAGAVWLKGMFAEEAAQAASAAETAQAAAPAAAEAAAAPEGAPSTSVGWFVTVSARPVIEQTMIVSRKVPVMDTSP